MKELTTAKREEMLTSAKKDVKSFEKIANNKNTDLLLESFLLNYAVEQLKSDANFGYLDILSYKLKYPEVTFRMFLELVSYQKQHFGTVLNEDIANTFASLTEFCAMCDNPYIWDTIMFMYSDSDKCNHELSKELMYYMIDVVLDERQNEFIWLHLDDIRHFGEKVEVDKARILGNTPKYIVDEITQYYKDYIKDNGNVTGTPYDLGEAYMVNEYADKDVLKEMAKDEYFAMLIDKYGLLD